MGVHLITDTGRFGTFQNFLRTARRTAPHDAGTADGGLPDDRPKREERDALPRHVVCCRQARISCAGSGAGPAPAAVGLWGRPTIMDERELRGLIEDVRGGRLSRRAFTGTMIALGLTAPI